MLEFFHKYQRAVFVAVTVMIVASFALFGALDTFTSGSVPSHPDRVVARAVDGSKIMSSQLEALRRFLATDVGDIASGFRGTVNLCNDGVIRKDLLETGLAEMVASSYFEECREALSQRLEKLKRTRGYVHPENPAINVHSVWSRFMPAIEETLHSLQSEPSPTPQTFAKLASLYQMQMACTPEFVRRVLLYDQHQQNFIQKDPSLQYVDLSLGGFHSLSDWFGRECLDLFSTFILNGARYAESKGYVVSSEEAKGDLLRNFQISISRLSKMPGIESVTFLGHLHSLGLDEKSAVEAWRSVLLFRRYFQGIGEAVFLDDLPYRHFAGFAKESALIEKYSWHPSLHLKTFQDLIDFQVYLKGLGAKISQISLPGAVLSKEEIALQTPDLVHTTYRVKMGKVTLDEVSLRIPSRDVLEWQLEDRHWSLLQKEFPFLEGGDTQEERLALLEKISAEKKGKVDGYVRLAIVQDHPEWISESLQKAPFEIKTVSLSSRFVSLPGIGNVAEFAQALSQGGDYSEDGRTFYRFEEVEEIVPSHVLTFEEAKSLGVTTHLSDQFLNKEYEKIREKYKDQFQAGQGWKLFPAVKEEVAKIVFRDLLLSIGPENMPLAYYASHRLEIPAKEELFKAQYSPEESQGGPLVEQFRCVKTKTFVQRAAKDAWMKEQLMMMDVGQWSSIDVPSDGNVTFFYLESKQNPEEPILEQISFGKEKIGADAQRYAAQVLLSLAKQKNSIHKDTQ